MTRAERTGMVGYLGHDPELFNDTIENNILMGEKKDAGTFLKMVCMEKEVAAMDDAKQSLIGSGGVPAFRRAGKAAGTGEDALPSPTDSHLG